MSIAPVKTVIILGAGGSMPFGYPSGNGLRNQIIDFYNKKENLELVRRILFNNRGYIDQQGLLDHLNEEIKRELYRHDGRTFLEMDTLPLMEWTYSFTKFESIDEYISVHPENAILGKLGILLTLTKYERPEEFGIKNVTDPVTNGAIRGADNKWYQAMWSNVFRSRQTTYESFKPLLDSVHWITFNYDRSWDHYLHTTIKAYYGVSVYDLPITHVYGSLGSLNPESNLYNPYKPIPHNCDNLRMHQNDGVTEMFGWEPEGMVKNRKYDRHLFRLANGIDTYGIEYPKDKARNIQELIKKADFAYSFGFSFFEQNMNILFDKPGMKDINGRDTHPCNAQIEGTCYRLGIDRISDLNAFLTHYCGRGITFMNQSRKNVTIDEWFAEYLIRGL